MFLLEECKFNSDSADTGIKLTMLGILKISTNLKHVLVDSLQLNVPFKNSMLKTEAY